MNTKILTHARAHTKSKATAIRTLLWLFGNFIWNVLGLGLTFISYLIKFRFAFAVFNEIIYWSFLLTLWSITTNAITFPIQSGERGDKNCVMHKCLPNMWQRKLWRPISNGIFVHLCATLSMRCNQFSFNNWSNKNATTQTSQRRHTDGNWIWPRTFYRFRELALCWHHVGHVNIKSTGCWWFTL